LLERLLRSLGVYSLYEKWLGRQIQKGEFPHHVGVILDGNRRWAEKRGKNPWIGHRVGASKVEELVKWCLDLNIKVLTLYVFSTENIHRNPREVEELMNLIWEETQKALKDGELMREGVRIKLIGRESQIPKKLLEAIKELERKTEKNDRLIVNIAIAYGGKKEIVDAAKSIAEDVKAGKIDPASIDENLFQRYLYTSHLSNPDVDMVIRTSGEMRLSGFLLWQSAYSELVFLDVYWPEFRKIDLMRAIRIYQRRQRRFGR